MYGSAANVLFEKVNGKKQNTKLSSNAHNNEGFNDYHEAEPFQSTRLMLGVIGALPFMWSKPHFPSLNLTKSTFMVAVLTIFLLGLMEYNLVVSCNQLLVGENLKLTDAIIVIELEFFSSFYFLNFAVWSDVPAAKQTVEQWNRLEKLFQEMTGRQLARRRRSLEYLLNFSFVIFPYICFTLTKLSNPNLPMHDSFYPVIMQSCTLVMIVCFLWISYFGALGKIATFVNADLQKDIHNSMLTTQKLRQYRDIWLQMRSISDSASTFNAPIIILVLTVSIIVFAIYNITLLFRSGDVFAMISHTVICTALIFFMTYMASATSSGIKRIRDFYNTVLSREGLRLMSNAQQREVIGIYLSERTRSPVPTYGGFVVVNRALVTSIFAAVATYLVVLAQFTYSIDF